MKTAVIFQDGMILQRNKPVVIWGTGEQGETVRGEIQGKQGETTVDADGKWMLRLPALEASKEEELVLRSVSASGVEEIKVLKQVAVGEVWVAGGQSNMEFHMRYEKHKAEAMEHCGNPRIRFFDVPEVCYDGQAEEFDYSRMGIWRKADQDNLEYFSAVGYYFQREIENALDVPVGIIGCNWGGSRSCVWMSQESLERVGKPWVQMYEERTAQMDMDGFWKKQHGNPMNHRGDPFSDPFGETVLPRTLSAEELEELTSKMPGGMEEFLYEMQPQEIPGCLYEHMLKTIAPYGIRGFLWYQGESDDEPGKQGLYGDMLTALIKDWRALWMDPGLPFLLVQLPGWENWLGGQGNIDYMTIRKCQERVAKTVEHAYLCSISDAGEQMDIHPKDKKVVGERLALLARGHVYGEDLLCDAPVAQEIRRDGDCVEITFANAEGGLEVRGDRVEALHIYQVQSAGTGETISERSRSGKEDREEIAFTADTEGGKLVIRLPKGTKDVTIEFARTRWYLVNLYNQAGIPAIPFEFAC